MGLLGRPLFMRGFGANRKGRGGIEPGYWIDAVAGNDGTGTGSPSAPWATLSKALSVATAGSIINCRTGIYTANNLTASQNNLTIRAGNNQTPVFTHATKYAAASWSKTGGLTNVYEAADVSANCWGVYNGATLLTSVGSTAICDATPNSRFFDDPGNKLYINVGGVPGDIYSEDSNNYIVTLSGTGQVVDGLTVQWSMQTALYVTGNATLRNCVARYWVPFGGVGFSPFQFNAGSGGTASGCTVTQNYTDNSVGIGITATASNVTVTGCTVTESQYGVYIAGGTGHTVTGSTFRHIRQDGVNFQAGSGTVSYCTVSDPAHGGVRCNGSGTVTMHHNIVYWTSAYPNTASRYGYIVDANASGNIYNNVACNGLSAGANAAGVIAQAGTGTATVKNNIFYKNTAGASAGAGTLVSDYNDVNQNTVAFTGGYADGANGITSDPLFTNEAANTYTLQAGSPCINAGVVIPGITDGYLGTAPDIGRYETA